MEDWILVGRLVQILLACVLAGFSFANAANEYSAAGMMFTAAFLGIDVIIFGGLGLFDTKGRSNTNTDIRLYLVIFILDCLALVFSVTASTLILAWINRYWGYRLALLLVPVLAGYGCAILILLFIIRNARLWWRRLLSAPPIDSERGVIDTKVGKSDFRFPSQAHHVFDIRSIASEGHGPVEILHSENADGSSSENEIQSNSPSRPMSFETTAHWSAATGAVTLTFPNIMSRASSQFAPSYITKPDAAHEA